MATETVAEPKRLTKKQYEKELARLQVELVRLQEWIVARRPEGRGDLRGP